MAKAMSYRTLRNVVRRASLERKCRWLFLVALSLLVTATFWSVEHIAEDLVKDSASRKGRNLVDAALLRYHWDVWVNEPDNPELKDLAAELSRDLQTQKYDWKILSLEPAPAAEPPQDDERPIIEDLKAKFQQQIKDKSFEAKQIESAVVASGPGGPVGAKVPTDLLASGDVAPAPTSTTTAVEIVPVSAYRQTPDRKEIHYYQPVYWKESCIRCHEGFEGFDAFSTADAAMLLDKGKYPFRVVKVIIPDHTQEAIAWNRALLAGIGILTVFLAMIALYVIMRMVVVKPLRHLRDVSEEISRGNTSLRAVMNTNDEFEELANAFNRMLHHLTEAQAELRQVNQDLDAKVDQLAQLNMRLYEMNRLKSDFLANMSHELRTPLNSIIGFSEVLQGIDSLNDKQKRYAKNIQKSGRLLLDLINDILDLAKIESGKMDVRPSEFRIDTVVSGQCDMVRPLAEQKNIDLLVDVDPAAPPMFQDQNKIQQVLINLLSNAIKFTPEGGRVIVGAVRNSRGRLQLTVADTGVGIAEEDREIIFEKFRQSSTTVGDSNLTREYSGTGLGLSIVKEFCKLLGGEISFVSELGKGTTFTVTLPWALSTLAGSDNSVEAQLDDLTKLQRIDLQKPHAPSSPNFATVASP